MDKSALYKTIAEGIRGGFLAPNEGRLMDNRKPIAGGDTVYLQEQDHSLQALAERDAGPPPDPVAHRQLESLRLARADLERQLKTTPHAARRAMLEQAIADLDRRLAEA